MSKKKWLILACVGMLGLGIGNGSVVNAETLRSSSQEISMLESEVEFREGDFVCTVLEDGTLEVRYSPLEAVNVKEVTLPSDIAGKMVTSIGRVGYFNTEGLDKITKINIPDTINNIADFAFSSVENLETITVYGDAESMPPLTIGYGAFNNNMLQTIDEKLLSNVSYIGDSAFGSRTGMSEINIKGNSIKIEQHAFGESVKKLRITGNDIVLNKDALWMCSKLEELELQGVTSLGENFGESLEGSFNNLSIVSISGNGFDIPNGKSMETRYPNLKELRLQGVKNIGEYAFRKSESLDVLEFSDGLISIGKFAFYGCSNLKEIALPNSVQLIGQYAFTSCSQLEKVTTFGTTINQSEDNIIDGFSFCSNLKVLQIPKSIGKLESFLCSGNSSLQEVVIPDGCVEIGYQAFFGCTALETISLPNSINTIEVEAFDSCKNLKTIETFGEKVTEGGEGIGRYAFGSCTNLQSVTLPKSVSKIDTDAFSQCTSLITLNIPEGITEIAAHAFSECTGLMELVIPSTVVSLSPECMWRGDWYNPEYSLKSIIVSENNQNYTSRDGVLFNKEKTDLLLYPPAKEDSCYAIPDGVINIGEEAFKTSNIRKVEFPDSLLTIGDRAFYSSAICIGNIEIGNSVKRIGEEAFCYTGGDSLFFPIINIPESVEYIGNNALEMYGLINGMQIYFYSKDCEIEGTLHRFHSEGNSLDWTLYGYRTSTAYDYAEKYGIRFVDIETGEQLLPIVEATANPAPTEAPTATPAPTEAPTATPAPTEAPTATPVPTEAPTAIPVPTEAPTATPAPTEAPTATPAPTEAPTATPAPTEAPTATPVPTEAPTATPAPTEAPTATPAPTEAPTATPVPTEAPTATPVPTEAPTATPVPTEAPTATPVPTEAPTATPVPISTQKTEEKSAVVSVPVKYVVQRGDYLGKIAVKYGLSINELLDMNPQIKNPNLIYRGQELVVGMSNVIKDEDTDNIGIMEYYTVKRGDSLYKIARKHNMSLNELYVLNKELFTQRYIFAGQKIRIK